MKVNFFSELDYDTTEYQALIKRVFRFKRNKPFNIIFVDDARIQEINREFRNIDRVTDVISFALCDDPDNLMDDSLGDIFINLHQAFRQANDYGHSIDREIAFLAVHGYLHLCGYDHQTPEEEKVMFAKQEEILVAAKLERI